VTIILESLNHFLPGYASNSTFRQNAIIFGALLSVTAATSIMATLIIAYQIYSLTSNSKSRKNYWYIVEIMVQSVSVYSALMVAQAICLLALPNDLDAHTELYLVSGFLNALGIVSSVSQNPDI